MLLVHKDISHMPITELESNSESIWVKVFANKTSHFVASWYRPPGSSSEEFQLFREQLDYIRTHHKCKKLPSAHVLGDFDFNPCGGRKTSPRTSTIVQFIFYFGPLRSAIIF